MIEIDVNSHNSSSNNNDLNSSISSLAFVYVNNMNNNVNMSDENDAFVDIDDLIDSNTDISMNNYDLTVLIDVNNTIADGSVNDIDLPVEENNLIEIFDDLDDLNDQNQSSVTPLPSLISSNVVDNSISNISAIVNEFSQSPLKFIEKSHFDDTVSLSSSTIDILSRSNPISNSHDETERELADLIFSIDGITKSEANSCAKLLHKNGYTNRELIGRALLNPTPATIDVYIYLFDKAKPFENFLRYSYSNFLNKIMADSIVDICINKFLDSFYERMNNMEKVSFSGVANSLTNSDVPKAVPICHVVDSEKIDDEINHVSDNGELYVQSNVLNRIDVDRNVSEDINRNDIQLPERRPRYRHLLILFLTVISLTAFIISYYYISRSTNLTNKSTTQLSRVTYNNDGFNNVEMLFSISNSTDEIADIVESTNYENDDINHSGSTNVQSSDAFSSESTVNAVSKHDVDILVDLETKNIPNSETTAHMYPLNNIPDTRDETANSVESTNYEIDNVINKETHEITPNIDHDEHNHSGSTKAQTPETLINSEYKENASECTETLVDLQNENNIPVRGTNYKISLSYLPDSVSENIYIAVISLVIALIFSLVVWFRNHIKRNREYAINSSRHHESRLSDNESMKSIEILDVPNENILDEDNSLDLSKEIYENSRTIKIRIPNQYIDLNEYTTIDTTIDTAIDATIDTTIDTTIETTIFATLDIIKDDDRQNESIHDIKNKLVEYSSIVDDPNDYNDQETSPSDEELISESNVIRAVPEDKHVISLLSAVNCGRVDETIKLLRDFNFEIMKLKNYIYGSNLYYVAIAKNFPEIVKLLKNYFIDFDLTTKGQDHSDLFLWFCSVGNLEKVVLLLDYDEELLSKSVDECQRNGLHLAVYCNNIPIVECLLATSNGQLMLNSPDINEKTPLMLAAYHGRTDIVKLLLQQGHICVNATSKYGKYLAIDYAIQRGHKDIVELLSQFG